MYMHYIYKHGDPIMGVIDGQYYTDKKILPDYTIYCEKIKEEPEDISEEVAADAYLKNILIILLFLFSTLFSNVNAQNGYYFIVGENQLEIIDGQSQLIIDTSDNDTTFIHNVNKITYEINTYKIITIDEYMIFLSFFTARYPIDYPILLNFIETYITLRKHEEH